MTRRFGLMRSSETSEYVLLAAYLIAEATKTRTAGIFLLLIGFACCDKKKYSLFVGYGFLIAGRLYFIRGTAVFLLAPR